MVASEPVETEWTITIQLVQRREGSLHFSIDYKKGKAVTVH